MRYLVQSILKKAGKASALGSLEENDPDAADDDDEEDDEQDDADIADTATGPTVVDKLIDLMSGIGIKR